MTINVNSKAIANVLSLQEARDVARLHEGSEVIVKEKNGSYSVHELNPTDVGAVVAKKGSDFEPSAVEFSIQKPNKENEVIINHNAKFTDKARSELLTAKEETIKLGLKVDKKVDDIKEKLIDNTEKLFNKITNKTNKYVKGAETVDINKGKVRADCSGFVTEMFKKSGVDMERTSASEIGSFIRGGKGFLKEKTQVKDINPTDIITFDKDTDDTSWYTGHVMIAVGTPEAIYDKKDPKKVVGYNVDIIDSTSAAHGNDKRNASHSGAGFGTISFSVDRKGEIDSFYWGKDLTGKKHDNNVTVGTMK